jgi:hypothetical protein
MELSLVIYAEGSAGSDNLVHRVSQLDFDILSLAGNPYISITKFTEKIQGRAGLLPQSKLKSVLRATLTNRFFYIITYSVKAIRRISSIYTLMRTLMIVIADPVIEPLAGVCKRGKQRIVKELGPYSFPEPLYFSQRHGMVRSTAYMTNSLPLENLLELSFATPCSKLTAIVR